MSIPEFIAACDSYCARAVVSKTWLSKRLFNDTYRLAQLGSEASDIGVRRLARAVRDLAELEQQLDEVFLTGAA